MHCVCLSVHLSTGSHVSVQLEWQNNAISCVSVCAKTAMMTDCCTLYNTHVGRDTAPSSRDERSSRQNEPRTPENGAPENDK